VPDLASGALGRTADAQVFRGRHPAIIDRATFDIVQARLDEKRVAGERPQKAVTQVREAKTRLIRALEAKQDALVEMRFSENSISASVFSVSKPC
jgi:hypothetical protein